LLRGPATIWSLEFRLAIDLCLSCDYGFVIVIARWDARWALEKTMRIAPTLDLALASALRLTPLRTVPSVSIGVTDYGLVESAPPFGEQLR
jgi:hypothetical protein